jgi:uncharacterized damage-inducible protein DinB
MTERNLTVSPLPGYPHQVGVALWMLEDTRRRTRQAVEGLTPDHVDAVPEGVDNAVGSLLYHIAAVEADWLYADILEISLPDWTVELFPMDVRENAGRLTPFSGETLDDHLARLATVRSHLLRELRVMTIEEFHRVRRVQDRITTPEWVLHHLREHEAEHRGQIQAVRTALGNRPPA